MATAYGSLAVFMWGLLALLGSLTKAVPPFQLLFLCFAISAAILPLRRVLRGLRPWVWPSLSHGQWLWGIAGLFGFHYCYFLALQHAPVVEVSLIVYLWPLLLSVMVAARGRRGTAIAGGVLGFVGVAAIVVADGEVAFAGEAALGYLLALACAGIWSTYSWYLATSKGAVEDIGWLSLAVAGLSLGAHLTLEAGDWALDARQWFGVMLLGLGPVGGAFYLWDRGLKLGNRSLLASLSFAAPLISAVALAIAGLNHWSGEILFALVLVTLGALVGAGKSRVDQPKSP